VPAEICQLCGCPGEDLVSCTGVCAR
jgi:hypothetical protein